MPACREIRSDERDDDERAGDLRAAVAVHADVEQDDRLRDAPNRRCRDAVKDSIDGQVADEGHSDRQPEHVKELALQERGTRPVWGAFSDRARSRRGLLPENQWRRPERDDGDDPAIGEIGRAR